MAVQHPPCGLPEGFWQSRSLRKCYSGGTPLPALVSSTYCPTGNDRLIASSSILSGPKWLPRMGPPSPGRERLLIKSSPHPSGPPATYCTLHESFGERSRGGLLCTVRYCWPLHMCAKLGTFNSVRAALGFHFRCGIDIRPSHGNKMREREEKTNSETELAP